MIEACAIFMMAELIISPDLQGFSKPMPKNVNLQRSSRNIQEIFDPSSIKSHSENYPRFFTVQFEEISSRQINPYNIIETVPEDNLPL